MKEFVEKLIGRLEEKFKYNSEQAEIWRNGSDKDAFFREKKDLYMDRANTYGEVMRIVNQLAEEYNNGWIPCERELPKIPNSYLVTKMCEDDGNRIYETAHEIFWTRDGKWDCERDEDCEWEVIAWRKKVAPYQKGE